MGQVRQPCRRRHQLAQQLETLAVKLAAKDHDPGDIAAWARQAVGEALLYEIRPAYHDDRCRAS